MLRLARAAFQRLLPPCRPALTDSATPGMVNLHAGQPADRSLLTFPFSFSDIVRTRREFSSPLPWPGCAQPPLRRAAAHRQQTAASLLTADNATPWR
jgi:hypothetical protein